MGCGFSSLKGEAPPDITSEPIRSHKPSHHLHINKDSANPLVGTSTFADPAPLAGAPEPDIYDSPPDPTTTTNTNTTTTADNNDSSADAKKKRSLYERYQAARMGRDTLYTDEELKANTGMTRAEMAEWAQRTRGVGANQLSGTVSAGAHLPMEAHVGSEGRLLKGL
jgi:hypothetical protein